MDKRRPVLILKEYEDRQELLIFSETTQGIEIEKKAAASRGIAIKKIKENEIYDILVSKIEKM